MSETDKTDSAPEHAAARPEGRRGLVVGVVIVVVLLVAALVWWLVARPNQAPPSPSPSATASPSASPSAGSTPSPSTAPSPSGEALLPDTALAGLLLTDEQVAASGLGLGTPSRPTAYEALLTSATPADCAVLVDTVPAAPAGFASLVATEGDASLVQRVYRFETSEAAEAAFTTIQSRSAACGSFDATLQGGGQASEGFEESADGGRLVGLTWNRSVQGAQAVTGWQRTVRDSNVVVEMHYLAPAPPDGAAQAVGTLFAEAEEHLTDAVAAPR